MGAGNSAWNIMIAMSADWGNERIKSQSNQWKVTEINYTYIDELTWEFISEQGWYMIH